MELAGIGETQSLHDQQNICWKRIQ